MGNSKTIWRWNLTTREIGTNTEYPEVLCRHYSLGFGLGEAPDEAHRGQGLPWPRWEELPGGWGSTPKGVPFILGKGARDWLSIVPCSLRQLYAWLSSLTNETQEEICGTISGNDFSYWWKRGVPFFSLLPCSSGCCLGKLWCDALAAIPWPWGGYYEHAEGARAEGSVKSPVIDQPWDHTLPEFLLFEKNHLKSLSV